MKRHRAIELKRTSRSGAQVVRINADLLHFQFAPAASESSTGGVDLIGAKVAAEASVRNTITSKGRFIASSYFRWVQIGGVSDPSFDQGALISGVGFSLSSRARKIASSNGANAFVAERAT